MAHKLIPSAFSLYEQTEQEQLAGSSFSQEQLEFIQNQITLTATSRMNINVTPESYSTFIQEEAYSKGMMDAYKYLLDCHETSQQALLNLAESQQQFPQ